MALFNFENLKVYEVARAFKKRVYKLTLLLPDAEQFCLRQQMRRAALSITNCIAEGHGRYTFKDRVHFLRQSRGSLYELIDDFNDIEDLDYAKPHHLANLKEDAESVLKLINGYISYIQRQARAQSPNRVSTNQTKSPN